MTQIRRLFLTASALALGASGVAAAQNDAAAVDDRRLGVITVTAQKVEQNLQDVPISVSAVDGATLEARQIDGFDQLQYIAPGISFNAGINARTSATTIRGIGTGLFNIGIEASTAIAIDGVVMGREGAGVFDFADVERIEVLRGPQGTLFGKNASAGVVSVITRGPTDEFSADFGVSYGSFNEVNLSGAISGPIADGVTGRVSAYSNTRDGYIDNVNPNATQDELNERNEQGMRAKLNFDLSDSSALLFSADYVQRDQASGALTYRSISPGGPGTGLLGFGVPVSGPTSLGLGITPGPENLQIGSEAEFSSEMDAWGLSAEYNKSFGDHEFVSLTSYREWNSVDNNDADLIPLPFLSINIGDLAQSQFSQEFRIDSPRDQQLTYTVGAFYFEQDMDQSNIQGGTAGLDLLGALPTGLQLGTLLESDFKELNYAVFGQGEYAVTEDFSLIAGVRFLETEVEGSQVKSVASGFVGPYAGQSVSNGTESQEDKDSAFVWRLGGQYYIDGNTNIFATISQGYKAPGIVTGLTVNPIDGNTLPRVAPEIPTQFEVGLRRTSPGGRLMTNLTGFYTEIEDFQAQTLIPGPSGTSIFTVANAGNVESYGFEGEITALPTDQLTLSAALAYTNATFDEFSNAPCYALQSVAEGCVVVDGQRVQDLAGADLANSPEWVINALVRYDFNITQTMPAFAQLGAQYRGEAQSSITNDPNTLKDAYTLLDAQIGVDLFDGRGTFTVFGRNLTDESFVEAIAGMPFDTGGYAQFLTLEAQQTWGAKLSLRY